MSQTRLVVTVREPADRVRIFDLQGEIGRDSKVPLEAAFEDATRAGAETIALNLQRVKAMDSMGLELLITLLARAHRQGLRLVACGLSAPLQDAFQIAHFPQRLDGCPDEEAARAALGETRPAEDQSILGTDTQEGWAAQVDLLAPPDLPAEAINLNVQGRRATGPIMGFGPLWLRTYQVHLVGSTATPAEVIRVWKEQFAGFWPPGSDFYGADRPIQAGDVGMLNLAGPAGTTIATGVLVIYASDESFCFLSIEGHMFGGMITFSAHQENSTTVVQVRALLRSSDPMYEMGQRLGFAVKAEDAFWNGTLTNLAAHFGAVGEPVRQDATLIDPTIHWAKATNLWYNAAIRTTLHLPIRWVRGLLSR